MNNILKEKFFLKITLLTVLTPFLALSFFNHPSADDFCYAVSTKNTFLETQLHWFYQWSGRYFSTAVLTLFPLLFDFFVLYKILPFFYFAGFYASFWLGLRLLPQKKRSKKEISFEAFVLLVVYIVNTPSVVEGYYWFPGSATYQLPNIMAIFLFTLLLSFQNTTSLYKKKGIIILSSFLAFFIAGSNESIMLVLILTLFVGVIFTTRVSHTSAPAWKIVFFLTLIGGALSAVAPGNSVRMVLFPHCCNFLFSFFSAYKETIKLFFTWSKSIELLSLSVLSLPLLSSLRIKTKGKKPLKSASVLAFIFSWISLGAVSIFPAFWSMAESPPARSLNVSYFIFFIGWFFTLLLISASYPHLHKKIRNFYYKLFYCTLILGLLLNVNFKLSLDDLFLYAPSYNRQLEKRYGLIEKGVKKNQKKLKVPGIKNPPEIIFFGDIIVSNKHWKNRCYAKFFNLKSIETTSVTSSTL